MLEENLEKYKDKALTATASILTHVMMHDSNINRSLLVYDQDSALSSFLAECYLIKLPTTEKIIFESTNHQEILQLFEKLNPKDLVVLIQSSSFRLDQFRIRVELFKKGLKVIEHPHLGRLNSEEIPIYLNSIHYDPHYYRRLGHGIKERLNKAQKITLLSSKCELIYGGPFEDAKLNVGDYRALKNIGSQFPIGEVFSELIDLTHLNGKVELFAFGDKRFSVTNCQPPIVLHIEKGRVVQTENSTEEFEEILQSIRTHEEEVWVRELGFGLNPAMDRNIQVLNDVGIYERMKGIHLSLGAKHSIYQKEGFHRKKCKFHVDVFAITNQVKIDDEVIFGENNYLI